MQDPQQHVLRTWLQLAKSLPDCNLDAHSTSLNSQTPTTNHEAVMVTSADAPEHAAKPSRSCSQQTELPGRHGQAACDLLKQPATCRAWGAGEQAREQRVWSLAEDALQEHLDSGEARAQHQWDWDIFRCCSGSHRLPRTGKALDLAAA